MHDDHEDDDLAAARGIMNALAMTLLICAAVSLLAIYAVGWS